MALSPFASYPLSTWSSFLFHLEPRALDPKSFFIYDPESFLFHLEPGALNSESFFIYDPKSFLFHLKPRALDLESFFIYDLESFLFHLEPKGHDLELFFSFMFPFRAQSSRPRIVFLIYDPESFFSTKNPKPTT